MKKVFMGAMLCLLLLLPGCMSFSPDELIGSLFGGNKSHSEPAFEEQGITGPVHEANVGKIVFANERISLDDPQTDLFKDSFNATDYIWGRFYLPHSVQNLCYMEDGYDNDNVVYYYDVYVDGELQDWTPEREELYGEYVQRTTQQLGIYKPAEEEFIEGNTGWVAIVNSMAPGEHEIKVDLRLKGWAGDELEKVFATGSFTVIKEEGAAISIGRSFSDIEAKMSDPDLEARILVACQEYHSDWEEIWKKVKITSRDWDNVRHSDTGILLGRTITAMCYADLPDGSAVMQEFFFYQEYTGDGFSQNVTYYDYVYGGRYDVDPE